MASTASTMIEGWRTRCTAARRARNLRAGARPARAIALPAWRLLRTGAAFWIGIGGAAGIALGALLIAAHARSLSIAAGRVGALSGVYQADAFQPIIPGALFEVPTAPGITLRQSGTAALLVATGMRADTALRVDLCTQTADPAGGRLLPLRIGYQFSDVAAWVARHSQSDSPLAPRNVVLAAPGAPMPHVELSGDAIPGRALQVRWDGGGTASWIGDASDGAIVRGTAATGMLGREGWLLWGADSALRILRRPSAACPAGELQLQLFRPAASSARAQVIAFGAQGAMQAASLPVGHYAVPALAPPRLEDQALFGQLEARGLVRLGGDGLIELVPRDLAAWRAAPPGERAAALAGWDAISLDPATLKLAERLYHRADGDFVRAQAAIFNDERRLLAWRARPGAPAGSWQASVAGAPAVLAQSMPAAAARLFAQLPQGWTTWNRVAAWPATAAGAAARLVYTLDRPATGGEVLALMVAGRIGAVIGAQPAGPAQDACTGRACPSTDAVRLVQLVLQPGTRSVQLDVTPLNAGLFTAPGDEQYRHIRVAGGRLAWQSVESRHAAGAAALAPVALTDRDGKALWSDGAPSAAARAAGLVPLLGFRAEHANSVAGMLARLPGGTHAATLTLDLALQAASQGALDCIGMRRGHWDGVTCAGGTAVPEGRRAGMVIIDADNGEVLAAAGAGAGQVDAANWSEVRDFDRLDPARSPLRLPALQHDGGVHHSPGSTFKVISALGLELAAKRDPQLDALLGGMPLAAINGMAHARGFAFQTGAPAYPWGTPQAHITNYREQQLDRRAQDGRLGMAQALTYSLNTWFAWAGELSDRSLFGKAGGGAPDVQPLEPAALDEVRPIVAMAHRLGFERPLRLDGGLLPADFAWNQWDALQTSASHIDPVHTRHELRQMAIGLRMQTTPLQMALASAAVGQGHIVTPRLLRTLDGRSATEGAGPALGVRLDRIRAGMKGVVDIGTGAVAFRGTELDGVRHGLFGKTGTSPTAPLSKDAATAPRATVWFTGWLEPGSVPGQAHRLAFAAFVSHSEASGGDHAAPVVAAVLRTMARSAEQKGK